MFNREAFQYYRITESTYKALDRSETPHMNLGVWPAASIISAQDNLVRLVVSELAHMGGAQNRKILELGPGWGGSRKVIQKIMGEQEYWGVNCSAEQIIHARKLNQEIAGTHYVQGYFEDIKNLSVPSCESLLAIESLLHVQDKAQVLSDCHQLGIKKMVLAEICLEDPSLAEKYPLFKPSLKYTWSQSQYESYFSNPVYSKVRILDISESVFGGWSNALVQIDADSFSGHSKVLKQFCQSYATLDSLSRQGLAKYLLITAETLGPIDEY